MITLAFTGPGYRFLISSPRALRHLITPRDDKILFLRLRYTLEAFWQCYLHEQRARIK